MNIQKPIMIVLVLVAALGFSACSPNWINQLVKNSGANSSGGLLGTRGSGKVISESRSVSGISAVELETMGSIRISQGETEGLTIISDDNILPLCTSEVQDGVLELRTTGNISHFTKLEYQLSVKNLERLSVRSMGSATMGDLKGKSFRLELSSMGGANLGAIRVKDNLEVDVSSMGSLSAGPIEASKLSIKLSSAGSAQLGDATATTSAELDMSGMGSLQLASLEAPALRLECAGNGGTSIGRLVGQSLEAKLNGMGNVQIQGGTVSSQVVEVNSMGGYQADGLASRTARIRVTSMGNAGLRVSDQLDAQVSSNGSIDYAGNPPVVKSKRSGMGSINQR